MTTTEALEKLKARYACEKREIKSHCAGWQNENCMDCSLNYEQGNMGERFEAFEIAMAALEKQLAETKEEEEEDGHDET